VNKDKEAFDWTDKEDMLECLKKLTFILNAGKCAIYHPPP
jgi:hypothetical protein